MAESEKKPTKQELLLASFDSVWQAATNKHIAPERLQKPRIEFGSHYYECRPLAEFVVTAAFITDSGSIAVCPTLLDADESERRYIMAHELVHVIEGHHLKVGAAKGKRKNRARVVVECEATVGSAIVLGKEEVVPLIEERLSGGLIPSIYVTAYKRALAVLEGRRKGCR